MSSVSDAALAKAEGVLRDVLGTGEPDAMRVAEDFFGLSDLVRTDPRLLRSLTDPGRSATDKAVLVRHAFAAHVQGATLDVLDVLVADHWSDPEEFRNALEVLGITAVLEDASRSGELDAVEQEIFEVSRLLTSQRTLRDDLSDLGRGSAQERSGLALRIFGPHVSKWTMRLVRRGVARTSHGRLLATLRRFSERASLIEGRRLVTVLAAAPLSTEQVQRLRAVLSARFGTEITINVSIDPTLVGGFRLLSGTTAVDSSISTQIDGLRRSLVH